jgi:hypothetical protein
MTLQVHGSLCIKYCENIKVISPICNDEFLLKVEIKFSHIDACDVTLSVIFSYCLIFSSNISVDGTI